MKKIKLGNHRKEIKQEENDKISTASIISIILSITALIISMLGVLNKLAIGN